MLPNVSEDNERIIYTNLGIDEELDELFIKAEKEKYFKAEKIIESYHNSLSANSHPGYHCT